MRELGSPPVRHWSDRTRLALVLTVPALLVVVIATGVILAVLSNLDHGVVGNTETGLARVGNSLALVIVTDEGAVSAAGTRDLVFDWGLLSAALALVPAAGVAWFVAGRVQSKIDDATTEIGNADEDRRGRLQEVVHELRTPLAVMETNLELAALDAEHDHGAVRYIEAARRAVDRMGRTVNDLGGHGRLAVEQDGPFDLAALAESAAAEYVGPARALGIHVLLTDSSPTMVPAGDPAAVRTAIGNFLSNAVRLAPRGSAVDVDWGEFAEWAWIAVTDEGPGLAPHLHGRAFERGWSGPHDRDRGIDAENAGLGLTIARQLTEAQGGAVTLESDEGGGATLTVWLPLENGADQNTVVAADQVHPAIKPWRKSPVVT